MEEVIDLPFDELYDFCDDVEHPIGLFVYVMYKNSNLHDELHVSNKDKVPHIFTLASHYVREFASIQCSKVDDIFKHVAIEREKPFVFANDDEKELYKERCIQSYRLANDIQLKQYRSNVEYLLLILETPESDEGRVFLFDSITETRKPPLPILQSIKTAFTIRYGIPDEFGEEPDVFGLE